MCEEIDEQLESEYDKRDEITRRNDLEEECMMTDEDLEEDDEV